MGVKYFDHAASSWPKPPAVIEAMKTAIAEYSANPGRGSHQMAVQASRVLFETRTLLAKLFHIQNPNDIAFSWNTTSALNLAIKGFLRENDHVICTNIEHNSVRRPLEYLKRAKNVKVTYLEADEKGNIAEQTLERAFTSETRLLIINHSSNLLGNILPIEQMCKMAKERGVHTLIDAAQTAGTIPIDVEKMHIDMLAFPGHKGLLGPQGTGGLYIHPDIDLEPLLHGGTGSQSEEIEQPAVRPDRYEAGTLNTTGIAGLKAAVEFILEETPEKIHAKEWKLTQQIMKGMQEIGGINILGPELGEDRTGIVSFTMDGMDASEVAFILDQSFQIAVRSGYHCSPLAHETAGTYDQGAVRASVGYFTTEEEVNELLNALELIKNNY